MEKERLLNGFKRIRQGFLLLIPSSVIGLIVAPLTSPRDFLELGPGVIAYLIFIGILGMVSAILVIASWILRIVGWGNICGAGIKRFYCYTRLLLIVLPIVGVAISIIGGIIYGIQVFTSGLEYVGQTLFPPTLLAVIIAGSLIITAGFLVEGVSLLDISYIYGRGMLRIASILYLLSLVVSTVLSIFSTTQAVFGATWMGLLSNTLQLVSSITLYIGLRVKIEHV